MASLMTTHAMTHGRETIPNRLPIRERATPRARMRTGDVMATAF
jgi:hypothetical protein